MTHFVRLGNCIINVAHIQKVQRHFPNRVDICLTRQTETLQGEHAQALWKYLESIAQDLGPKAGDTDDQV